MQINKRLTFEDKMRLTSEEAFNNRKYVPLCIKLVEDLMGVEHSSISISRIRDKALARHLLHYALRTKTTMTLEAIGKITRRDHATVTHSISYIEDVANYDSYIGLLKRSIDNETVPKIFKIRELMNLANHTNKSASARIEGIYRVILNNIEDLQYENANILRKDYLSNTAIQQKERIGNFAKQIPRENF